MQDTKLLLNSLICMTVPRTDCMMCMLLVLKAGMPMECSLLGSNATLQACADTQAGSVDARACLTSDACSCPHAMCTTVHV